MGCAFGYCFSGPLPLHSHKGEVTFHGACFWESLVIRLHSEIGQIHLSIEAQCGSPVYLLVTTTLRDGMGTYIGHNFVASHVLFGTV